MEWKKIYYKKQKWNVWMEVVFGVTTYLLANKPNRITLLSLKFDLQQETYEYVTSQYYSLIKYTSE